MLATLLRQLWNRSAPPPARIEPPHGAALDLDAAIDGMQRALALNPRQRAGWTELVGVLKATARYDEAEDRCREALAAVGADRELRRALAGVLFEQGRVEEAVTELRSILESDPHAVAAHSDLVRALNYLDGEDPLAIFAEHREWGRHHADSYTREAAPHAYDRNAERRLRVGYVSPYFRRHAVTFFLESVIEHHDRSRFDVLLYADVTQPDEYSDRLRSYGAQWRETAGLGDDKLAELVRNDRIDILVDLSGQTPGNRLLAFARRPAPVQVTWNGYPNTTGMIGMDYRVTDALCDPPRMTEHLHTEKLVRLPRIYMSWRPPQDAPEVAPLPALAAGRVTFGAFNSCFKVSATAAALWARILHAIPGSRLKLFTVTGSRAADTVLRRFAAHGIARERLELVPRLSHEAFLAAHGDVDVALDTFPYHGTTTTCFSLWMGVPAIVLAGDTHVSRVGVSLLTNIGLPQLVARDGDAYVETAVGLTRDLAALAATRASLREMVRRSPLTDGAACATALEHAYREMWRTWCASPGPA